MDLSQLIASAEKKYKKRLEDFFTDVFSSTNLLSHGIDHHRRVWLYTKELLYQLHKESLVTNSLFPDKLIIACYLHDSGMSIDSGPRHGIHSRLLCEQFLRMYKLPEIDFADVLDAIEYHDNKEYSFLNNPGELLTILSVADDLDAFGFIGIYRYLEIYLMRGKSFKDISILIPENVLARYNNFVGIFGFIADLVEKHCRRYQIIVSFFDEYKKQLNDYQFDTSDPSGYCGVAEIIQYSVRHNLTFTGLYSYIRRFPNDKVLKWYFSELKNELSQINLNGT